MTSERRNAPFLRAAAHRAGDHDPGVVNHPFRRVRVYEIDLLSGLLGADVADPARHVLTMLFDDDETPTHLFVDEHPVDTGHWGWDAVGRRLQWACGAGEFRLEGQVEFLPKLVHGFGYVVTGTETYSAGFKLAPARYLCDVVPGSDAGAYLDTSTNRLVWDPASEKWRSADWQSQRFAFSYEIEGDIYIGTPVYTVKVVFDDLETINGWAPEEGETSVYLTASLTFNLGTVDGIDPPPDPGSSSPVGSVFPYRMDFQWDGFAANLDGAMLTGENSIRGDVVAIHGVTVNPALVGLYRVSSGGRQSIIALRNGNLRLDDQTVANSHVEGVTLHYAGLSPEQCSRTGLPASGHLTFSPDGHRVVGGSQPATGARVSYSELSADATDGNDSALARRALSVAGTASSPVLATLLNQTQFAQDDKGAWSDAVQTSALADFYTALKWHMDPDLRKQYLDPNPVDIDPQVRAIAELKGKDGSDPQAWYRTLSVAYLTNVLRQSTDEAAAQLNAIRAQEWIKSAVAQASVYQVQSPAFYNREFVLRNPQMTDFLEDQAAKSAAYSAFIASDVAAWKAQADQLITGDPDRLASFKTMIDTVAAVGEDKKYWGYLFFRYCTQPSALNLMELISIGGSNVEGSTYARRVQTNCAVLEILDPTSTLSKQYIQAIALFQIANMLPQLLDYGGDISDYKYAAQEILQAFIAKNLDNPDPDIQKVLAEAQTSLDNQWLSEVLGGFAAIGASFQGMYTWEQLARKFEQDWPKISKIPIGAAKIINMAVLGAGMVSFVYGVKSWKDLDDDARVSVVATGAEVFTEFAAAVVKRGISWTVVLKTDAVGWQSVGDVFKSIKGLVVGDAITAAENRMSAGSARWLIRTGRIEVQESSMFGSLFVTEGEQQELFLTKIFGANMDEFIATRLSAVFAVIGLVTSAIALSEGGTEMEVAANSLFVAASSLELIAAVGAWALPALGVEAIGGLTIAAIASAFTIVAALAAVAGAVLLIYVLFYTKPPSMVQKFVDDHAKGAGYAMPLKSAIDYFQITPDDTMPQLVGITVGRPDGAVLRMDPSNSVTIAAPDRSGDTCFYLSTDAVGRARFLAQLPSPTGELLASYALTRVGGEVKALPVDPTNLGQLWDAPISGVQFQSDSPVSGTFTLSQTDSSGTTWYLGWDGTSVLVSTQSTSWTLTRSPVDPAHLEMADVVVIVDQTNNGSWGAYLGQRGSTPLTWAVQPELPGFLVLNPQTGIISWAQPGQVVHEVSDSAHLISVSNDYASTSAPFHVKVVADTSASAAAFARQLSGV